MGFETISRRLTPLFSLAGGVVTVFLLRRGINFAPIGMALAAIAWGFAILFSRVFAESPAADQEPTPRRRRLLRWFSRALVVGLYQNVLFFLLPIWFGSTELFSVNIIFPVLLAALALLSCFDVHFTRWVLQHRSRRTLASAVLLFSASVPVVTLQIPIPLRLSTALCAAVATFAAVALGTRWRGIFKTLPVGLLLAVLLGAVFYFVATILPPVPVQCLSGVSAVGIDDREPLGVADVFPAGIPRIYGHFSVVAPERFKQNIRFQWYANGEAHGPPIPSSILGGRKQGFRTWTYLSSPRKGSYRVDLETGDGQLIGRIHLRVE